MRAEPANEKAVRKVCLFGSVHNGLQFAFESLAVAESIKTPGYDEPTANATEKKSKLSRLDSVTQAVWVMKSTKESLTASEMAWATATYDGAGEAKRQAIDALADEYSTLSKSRELLIAVLDREFIIGETYCPSFATVAKDHGVSKSYAGAVGLRIQRAMRSLGNVAVTKLHEAYKNQGWLPH